jgi:hypothetical protein
MVNLNYLQTQLRQAAECIRRGLDALADDPQATQARKEITNVGSFDVPVVPPGDVDKAAKVMALAHTVQRVADHDKLLASLTERVDKLTRILLDINTDACAKHDLFSF